MVFEHPYDPEAGGINIYGYDSSIIVELQGDTVVGIRWSAYTG